MSIYVTFMNVSTSEAVAWVTALKNAFHTGSDEDANAVLGSPMAMELALFAIANEQAIVREVEGSIDIVFMVLRRILSYTRKGNVTGPVLIAFKDLIFLYSTPPMVHRLKYILPCFPRATWCVSENTETTVCAKAQWTEVQTHCIKILKMSQNFELLDIGLLLAKHLLNCAIDRMPEFQMAVLAECERFFNPATLPSMFAVGPKILSFIRRCCAVFPEQFCSNAYVTGMLLYILKQMHENPDIFGNEMATKLIDRVIKLLKEMLFRLSKLDDGHRSYTAFVGMVFPLCVNACSAIPRCAEVWQDDLTHGMILRILDIEQNITSLSRSNVWPHIIEIAVKAMEIRSEHLEGEDGNYHNIYNTVYTVDDAYTARTVGARLLCCTISADNAAAVIGRLMEYGPKEEVIYSFMTIKTVLEDLELIDMIAPTIVAFCSPGLVAEPRSLVDKTVLRVLARYNKWLAEEQALRVYEIAQFLLGRCGSDIAFGSVLFQVIFDIISVRDIMPCEELANVLIQQRHHVIGTIGIEIEAFIESKVDDGGIRLNASVRGLILSIPVLITNNDDFSTDNAVMDLLETTCRKICEHLSNPKVVIPFEECCRLLNYLAEQDDCDELLFTIRSVLEVVVAKSPSGGAKMVIESFCRWTEAAAPSFTYGDDACRILTLFLKHHVDMWPACTAELWAVVMGMVNRHKLSDCDGTDIMSICKFCSCAIQTGVLSPELLGDAYRFAFYVKNAELYSEKDLAEFGIVELLMSVTVMSSTPVDVREILPAWINNVRGGYFALPYFRLLSIRFLGKIAGQLPPGESESIYRMLLLDEVKPNTVLDTTDTYSWNAKGDVPMPIERMVTPEGFVRTHHEDD